VHVPGDLPIYGTSALIDYPIRVRVSEGCHKQPQTLIAILAHELSHVLLRSVRHRQWDNEIYTDLTPIILGFSEIVENGRKVSKTISSDNETVTNTTTYGYLTDSQFLFARDKIVGILNGHKCDKARVLAQAAKATKLSSRMKKNLLRFNKYLQYLDEHRGRKIKKQDSSRIVQFHSLDYTSDIERLIADSGCTLERVQVFCRGLTHFTSSTLKELQDYDGVLELLMPRLESHARSLDEDKRVLRRNVSLICLLKIAWMNRAWAEE
jgi:hypothetical protein